MQTIVITGSTRGIGRGLAQAFLERGCRVVISGRNQTAVDRAVEEFASQFTTEKVMGVVCDVSRPEDVQALWDRAKLRFGRIDIWINNAGAAHRLMDLWTIPPEEMSAIVTANILGTLHGVRTAVAGMTVQGYGTLYNMEGFGSNGRTMKGLSLYGMTKAAIHYLDKALVQELAGKPIRFGTINPGMVITDMLLQQNAGSAADWERSKRVFNILADTVETASSEIAAHILSSQANPDPIQRLNGFKVMLRFLKSPFVKRTLIK